MHAQPPSIRDRQAKAAACRAVPEHRWRFMKPHVSARHHAGPLCPANRGKVPPRSLTSRSKHSSTDKLVSWFLQLSLLAVWKSLTTFSAPVARVLALYVYTGKSILRVCSWATRLVLKLTGWLASPAFPHSRWIRQWSRHLPWPLDVRKWHVVVGGCAVLCEGQQWCPMPVASRKHVICVTCYVPLGMSKLRVSLAPSSQTHQLP